MRTFVRLLPRLLLLGVAATALLVLAGRERPAHAEAIPPVTPPLPASPAPGPSLEATVPALSPPPGPTLPLPTLPTVPAPPSLHAPPPLPPSPAPASPEPPDPPVLRALGAPAPDPAGLTGAVGPLSEVPEVVSPELVLPDLAPVTELLDLPTLLGRVVELVAAPALPAPTPANAPDRARAAPRIEPAASRVDVPETSAAPTGVDVGAAPARGPPPEPPGSLHPCSGGGAPYPTRAEPGMFSQRAAHDMSWRGGLLAEARAFGSTLLREPLLRPD
jgi:hypothetical protein